MNHYLLCLAQSIALISLYGAVGSGGLIFVLGFGGHTTEPIVRFAGLVFISSVVVMVLTGWSLDKPGGLKEK